MNRNRVTISLEKFYKAIQDTDVLDSRHWNIPHSVVFTTKYLIKEKLGKDLTTDQVEQLLYEEGLLPAKEYGIPKWYADKWLTPQWLKDYRHKLQFPDGQDVSQK